MRSLSAWLTACSCAVVLAGCGGSSSPKLAHDLGQRLADRSDAVAAANNACVALAQAQALQQATIAAVNARRVPAALQEQLQSAATDLVERTRILCAPPQRPSDVMHGSDKFKKHGKHGKKKKHGEDGGD